MKAVHNQDIILAVITDIKNRHKVAGSAPIFFTESRQELERVSALLARLTLGMVHDLGNGVRIIVRH